MHYYINNSICIVRSGYDINRYVEILIVKLRHFLISIILNFPIEILRIFFNLLGKEERKNEANEATSVRRLTTIKRLILQESSEKGNLDSY